MTTIDVSDTLRYSQLIPAVRALCNAKPGEDIELVMSDEAAFNDLKEYLSEQGKGFREIYDQECLRLQLKA